LVLHHVNYLRTGELTERFIHEVLSDTLWARKNKPAESDIPEESNTHKPEKSAAPSSHATVTIVELETD